MVGSRLGPKVGFMVGSYIKSQSWVPFQDWSNPDLIVGSYIRCKDRILVWKSGLNSKVES